MLFELGGRRKRFIQVIYVFLALLLGGGLVFFGIGGAQGGIGDAIGIGGDGGTSDPGFQNQIDRAEETLASDPGNEQALLQLAKTHFLAGQSEVEVDEETGTQSVVTEDALAEFQASDEAWQEYLATDPAKPDDSVASLMIRTYTNLTSSSSSSPSDLESQLNGAFEAAQIVAAARPSVGSQTQVASYGYLAGNDKEAAKAEKKALAAASDSTSRAQAKQQIQQAKQQGKAIAQYLKQSAPDQSDLENPLGGISGGSQSLPGGAGTP